MTLEDALKIATANGAEPDVFDGIFFPSENLLLAFARQVEAEALEKAAKLVGDMSPLLSRTEYYNAIRALSSPPAGRQDDIDEYCGDDRNGKGEIW